MAAMSELDNPQITIARRQIIRQKPLLYAFYRQCYAWFKAVSSHAPLGARLEIGSGPGFLNEEMPGVITSDIMHIPGHKLACSALALPFGNATLAAIYTLNTFHHLPDPAAFLAEADRCLMPGGIVAMIEPANTLWASFVYRRFHHEPFDPSAAEWRFSPGGPLSAANGAMPWIIFVRDRARFATMFPHLRIVAVAYTGPLLYLLSGGFSHPSFIPAFCLPMVRLAEAILSPLTKWLGMFMRVCLQRC